MQPDDESNPQEEDWRRPLSSRPEFEEIGPHGQVIRRDADNRVLCKAKRRDGNLCKAPAIQGAEVCKNHGGSAPQVKAKAKLRLAKLVDPAIATLAAEMVKADKSSDRQRAANSILDRAGFGRQSKFDVTDAKDLLKQRILDMREPLQEEENLR